MSSTTFAPARFEDADAAFARVLAIHDEQLARIRTALDRFLSAGDLPERARGCYPFVRVHVHTAAVVDSRLAYGFVAGPGVYETTLTRPRLFDHYLRRQFDLLLRNHGVALEIGLSDEPIPLHFAFGDDAYVDGGLDSAARQRLRDLFDVPNLGAMDDAIANGTHEPRAGLPRPLAPFTAPRIDYSLHRLRHYTGTGAEHFQNYVLFTNYASYVDEFVQTGRELMQGDGGHGYTAFVEPGNLVFEHGGTPPDEESTRHPPQMPAYHLVRPGHAGITLVNIGVGPANAKTITDHIAVLRPHAWVMLGHCAGLRNSQRLGDYVLAHGYVRQDHVLDDELPLWVPIPPLAEIQLALQQAVAEVTRLDGWQLKQIMRTGTVASVDNRNWELLPGHLATRRLSQSRAIALDMESATIAANGFRFRVPYGTLLCVSDKPLHGEIKLPGMANQFYRDRVDQHLAIGMRAMELLRERGTSQLHSRKLRSFAEVAFQ